MAKPANSKTKRAEVAAPANGATTSGPNGSAPVTDADVAPRAYDMPTLDDVVNRLRVEFLEMPGLRLTSGQVQRLCGVEKTLCQLGLDSLVATNFLYVKSDGVYARTTDGDVSRPRTARTGLGLPARLLRAP